MEFRCPCCGSKEFSTLRPHVLTTRTGKAIFDGASEFASCLVECSGCTHVMVHPAPSPEALHKFYSGLDYWQYHALEDDFTQRSWLEDLTANWGYWERLERAKEQSRFILDKVQLPSDARIIDLGSGFSPFLYLCRQQGFTDLHALEPSEEICRYLEAQGITTYPTLLEDFIERKDLPPFDLMLLSHALEHIPEPDAVVQGLRGLLSEVGVLLVAVPYRDYLRPFTAGLHIHFFNETSLPRLMDGCGYEVLTAEIRKLNTIDRSLIYLQNLVYEKRFAHKKLTATELLRSPLVDVLHRYCWQPMRWLLRLNIHILTSPQDLKVLARR